LSKNRRAEVEAGQARRSGAQTVRITVERAGCVRSTFTPRNSALHTIVGGGGARLAHTARETKNRAKTYLKKTVLVLFPKSLSGLHNRGGQGERHTREEWCEDTTLAQSGQSRCALKTARR
jgi:hypothetical protein